jgi:transposase
MKNNRIRKRKKRRETPAMLERINPNAAGIDCGSTDHFVAVPPDRAANPVRSFGTFTGDLHRLADWLTECGITSVAMEATGVYWIPVYEILEQRGFDVSLINARHVKNVPGRKSDVRDCEWIRDLHSVGLLRGSFRPADQIVALRGFVRHRETLVQSTSDIIQRMQKALMQMNVQLHHVITDITGQTGMLILRDIVNGQTDPHALARHRDPRCRASEPEIAAALTGNYRAEHVFVLKQNLELFDTYQEHLAACDATIEMHVQQLIADIPAPETPLPPPRKKTKVRGEEPDKEIRNQLYRLTGTDLSQIDGIGPFTALRLISEIGTDMTRWPTAQHFTSWLTLAPQNKVSGGRLLSSRTATSANRAAALLRMVALSVGRTQTALGAFYRRLAARVGKAKAITATARKLAILVYRTLKGELVYRDPGPDAYDRMQRKRVLRRLRARAANLGFALVDVQTGEMLKGSVS